MPKTKYEYKTYDTSLRPGETDEHYYKRLAKVADQRLVRLEELQGQKGFEGVEKFAYSKAMTDLEKWGGTRFNTKPPEERQLWREKVSDMIRFIEAPTSSKGGIVQVYKNRVNTFNEKYGLNMTWQDFHNFFQSGDAEKVLKDYGSDTTFKAIGKIRRGKLNFERGKNVTIGRNTPVDEAARGILRKYSLMLNKEMSKEEKRAIRAMLG